MLFLLMQLDGNRYALDIDQIVEVLPLVTLNAVPRAAQGIAGVVDYGGVFWDVALGVMYRTNSNLMLRAEAGYAGLKLGVAWAM